MSQQIYVSDSYKSTWKRDESVIYEIPLVWLDYLSKKNKELYNFYMRQLQERHTTSYLDPIKNLVLYQIETPKQTQCYLIDQCYKCKSPTGDQYVVGISKNIPERMWEIQYRQLSPEWVNKDQTIETEFLC